MTTIDLNADVGEGHEDLPIFPYVTSVSIACGAHAGDDETMERAVVEAARLGIAAGAHPSYPDREGYGRRRIAMSDDALRGSLTSQLDTLAAVARGHGLSLTHVKPHGALYNEAADDEALAMLIVEAVRGFDPGLVIVALAGSVLLDVASGAGLRAVAEGFADRRYRGDGRLASRDLEGALITDPEMAADQAARLASGSAVTAIDGTSVRLDVDTICLHSDTPNAAAIAAAVRGEIERRDVTVAPFSQI